MFTRHLASTHLSRWLTGLFLILDSNGHATAYLANRRGELAEVVEYSGAFPDALQRYASTSYTYDALSRLQEVTDHAGNHTQMVYDALGRKKEMRDPDMGTWRYAYWPDGSLHAQLDALNQRLCFYYDPLGRPTYSLDSTNLNCPNTAPATRPVLAQYTYDDGSQQVGRLTALVDAAGAHTFGYDRRGRLLTETRQYPDGRSFSLTVAYDSLDRWQTRTYPHGESVTQTYHRAGQPQSLTSTHLGALVQAAAYNLQGQPKSLSWGNGLTTWYGYYGYSAYDIGDLYDAQGEAAAHFGRLYRLCTAPAASSACQAPQGGAPPIASDQRLDLSYGYDAAGNVTDLTDLTNANRQTHYTYDALNRVLSSVENGGSAWDQSYTYAEIGNITSFNGRSYSYAAGQPHAVTSAGSDSYTYDANGNMTGRVENGMAYTQVFDRQNRLSAVSHSGGGMTYRTDFSYDAYGQRLLSVKWENGAVVSTRYTPFPGYEHEERVGSSPTPTPTATPTVTPTPTNTPPPPSRRPSPPYPRPRPPPARCVAGRVSQPPRRPSPSRA